MAHVSGKTGGVTAASFATGAYNWSFDWDADALETTDYGSSGQREYIAGLTGGSGTFVCRGDAANNTATVGTTVALTLTVSSGKTYTMTALITGKGETVPVDGLHETTVSFVATGSITKPA